MHPDPTMRWSSKKIKMHTLFDAVDTALLEVWPRREAGEREVRPEDLYAPGTFNPSYLPPLNSPPSSAPDINRPPNVNQPCDPVNNGDDDDDGGGEDWTVALPASAFRTALAVAAATGGGGAQWFSQSWVAWKWWVGAK